MALELAGQLKQTIACHDVSRVEELVTFNAALRELLRDNAALMVVRPGRNSDDGAAFAGPS